MINLELTDKDYVNGMTHEIIKRSENIGFKVNLQTYEMFLETQLESGIRKEDNMTELYCNYIDKCFKFVELLTKQQYSMKNNEIDFNTTFY